MILPSKSNNPRFIRVALAGVVVGLAVAFIGGRLVASSVYAMRASDPLVLATAGAIVALVTFAHATMVPRSRQAVLIRCRPCGRSRTAHRERREESGCG